MSLLDKIVLLFIPMIFFAKGTPINETYYEERMKLLEEENESYLGADIKLNEHEILANSTLMNFKFEELETGFQSPSTYNPSNSFLNRIKEIQKSNVFKFIKKLPKGGVLHVHDISLVRASWVVHNITYEENLYVSGYPSKPTFKWADNVSNSSEWTLISELRDQFTPEKVDEWLLKHLDIRVDNPYDEYSDIDKVWTAFMNVMMTVENLFSYAPMYDRYLYEGLSEFEKDGVSYIEIRTLFSENICADLQCTKKLSTLEVAKLNQKTIDRFLEDHPHFCGVTLIYAPIRGVSPHVVHMKYLNRLMKLRHYLPNLVRGFDLVGQEDKGEPLINFIKTLIKMKQMDPELQFVFHAGETNWQGFSTDENLIDAILLNTTRIGHGYALLKHPILKKLVAEKNIAVEICPISNQVLGLVKDMRNHPASALIAEGSIPLVISSDDPGSWGANGVSFDYYEAFMGLAGKHMDLRLLKKLFHNSLSYSLLNPQEKDKCLLKFDKKWNHLMKKIYHSRV